MIGLKPPISPFTIEYLSRSIRTGELLPSELTGLCLDRIKRFNHVLNSFRLFVPIRIAPFLFNIFTIDAVVVEK